MKAVQNPAVAASCVIKNNGCASLPGERDSRSANAGSTWRERESLYGVRCDSAGPAQPVSDSRTARGTYGIRTSNADRDGIGASQCQESLKLNRVRRPEASARPDSDEN